VFVELVDLGDLNDMEALTEEDSWLLPPSCFFKLRRFCVVDAPSSRHVMRRSL
jgi:hypothetical protein